MDLLVSIVGIFTLTGLFLMRVSPSYSSTTRFIICWFFVLVYESVSLAFLFSTQKTTNHFYLKRLSINQAVKQFFEYTVLHFVVAIKTWYFKFLIFFKSLYFLSNNYLNIYFIGIFLRHFWPFCWLSPLIKSLCFFMKVFLLFDWLKFVCLFNLSTFAINQATDNWCCPF